MPAVWTHYQDLPAVLVDANETGRSEAITLARRQSVLKGYARKNLRAEVAWVRRKTRLDPPMPGAGWRVVKQEPKSGGRDPVWLVQPKGYPVQDLP